MSPRAGAGDDHADAELFEVMFFDAAVVCHASGLAASAAARVEVIAATATLHTAPTVTPTGAHSTPETVRHETVDDRIGAALHVRQQVGRQL